MKEPTRKIERRLRNGVKAKVGQKVLVTLPNGTQYLAEVYGFHDRIKNWITKVKKVDDDGKVTIEEVGDLVVDAVILVKDIVVSDVFRAIGQFFKNLFKKKKKD